VKLTCGFTFGWNYLAKGNIAFLESQRNGSDWQEVIQCRLDSSSTSGWGRDSLAAGCTAEAVIHARGLVALEEECLKRLNTQGE